MPGISVSRICIPFNQRASGVTALSAIIEASAPDEIVITFSAPLDATSTPDASAFTISPLRTVTSVVISGDTVTLTVDSPLEYSDSVTVSYAKPVSNPLKDTDGEEIADFIRGVTNGSVVYSMSLESTGNGTGVSTLRMEVSDDITVTMEGAARFYSNAGGTDNESTTWSLTAGALRTIYLKCPSNSKMVFSDGSKIINFGDSFTDGWVSTANAANLLVTFTPLPLDNIRISGNSVITGALPSGMTGALILNGSNIYWTYEGPLPVGMTNRLYLNGNNIYWTYEGPLPSGLIYVYMGGTSIDWTGLDVGNGNITTFNLNNYRIPKMSSADMVIFLTNLTNRTGTLPAFITINDYADYASPPQEVTDAVNLLITTKGVTTVLLGA